MSDIATQNKPKGLRELLEAPNIRTGIRQALGGFMDEGNFLAQMLIALQQPGVVDCTLESKFKAVHLCATLGLLPTLGQVALIPRNMKDQGLCCTVMPQWQGFQALMLRHPDVLAVKATLVHVTDSYQFDPDTETISAHNYDPFGSDRRFQDFADLRGGYLVITYKDFRPKQYHCVPLDVFQRARKCAQSDNIWKSWFAEQCLKTIYRNAYARRVIPMDQFANRLATLVESEDAALGNDPDRISQSPVSAITYTPEPKAATRTEAAAQKMKKAETKAETKAESGKQNAELPFDVQLMKAETTEAVDAIFEAVKAAGLTDDEVQFYRAIAEKRVKTLTT